MSTATDAINVKRVLAEPYEKDGNTVIAGAAVPAPPTPRSADAGAISHTGMIEKIRRVARGRW